MTDLARFVAAAVKDRAVDDVMLENKTLKEENQSQLEIIQSFRDKIRYVSFEWAPPRPRELEPHQLQERAPGIPLYTRRLVDLSLGDEYADRLVRLGNFGPLMQGIPQIFPISYSDCLQSEIRFGDMFAISLGKFNFTFKLDYINVNDTSESTFRLGFVGKFVDVTSDKTITMEGYIEEDVSLEQFAGLTEQSTEEVKLKYGVDGLEAGYHEIADAETTYPMELFGGLVGHRDFELHVESILCPFGIIKQKCHLL